MIRIAVVDDEEAMRDMVCKCIKQTMKGMRKRALRFWNIQAANLF